MGICYVVGAGEFCDSGFAPDAEDCVIAADGGYQPLKERGVQPALLVGDFDSLTETPENVPILRFPVEKDDTDMGLALREGWARGYRRFAIYGGGGGRVDHLLANWQTMCRYSRMGASVWMVCADYTAYAITNGKLTLPRRPAGTLASVFCNGESASGVTLEGLYYPLHDAVLHCDQPLGVSNRYETADAAVSVKCGTLLVIVYDAPKTSELRPCK